MRLPTAAGAAPPPSPSAPRASTLTDAIQRAIQSVERDQVDAAWRAFYSVRDSVKTAPPAEPSSEAELQSALLELGRAFLGREQLEAALDVWHLAAKRGHAEAVAHMKDALRERGWPFWVHEEALSELSLREETPPEPLFGGAVVLSAATEAVPTERDPLNKQSYRYSLAVYVPTQPELRSPVAPSPSGEAGTPAAAGTPRQGLWWQRFLIHYREPEEEARARKLARTFAALNVLMERNLGRRSRFDANGRTHVWLVTEGAAGAEQWQEHLFFYELSRPRSNLEWTREAAHEYGHACLPGTGGFREPEGWADGELGERLLLRWLLEGNRGQGTGSKVQGTGTGSAGTGAEAAPGSGGEPTASTVPATGLDALELKASGLEAYMARYVEPLVTEIAEHGWIPSRLAKRDREAMEHVMGLALWAEEAHGTPFLRSMLDRIPHSRPEGIWTGYAQAVAAVLRRPQAKAGAAPAGGGAKKPVAALANPPARPQPLRVASVAGRMRFYVPQAGLYRLAWAAGGRGPITLVRPLTVRAQGSGRTASRSLKVIPGKPFAATPGWYVVQKPSGTVLLSRSG